MTNLNFTKNHKGVKANAFMQDLQRVGWEFTEAELALSHVYHVSFRISDCDCQFRLSPTKKEDIGIWEGTEWEIGGREIAQDLQALHKKGKLFNIKHL